MFGLLGKKGLKEGDFVFARRPDGEYNNIIFGAVTGVDGKKIGVNGILINPCLLYTSPSPRDPKTSRMPSSA